jgi:hypothetical protein
VFFAEHNAVGSLITDGENKVVSILAARLPSGYLPAANLLLEAVIGHYEAGIPLHELNKPFAFARPSI